MSDHKIRAMPPDKEEYKAFHAVDRQQFRLRVRPVSNAWERLTYNYLLRIVEDNGYGTEIALIRFAQWL